MQLWKNFFLNVEILEHSSGITTLIISNEEANDMKIVKPLEDTALLVKSATKTIETDGLAASWAALLIATALSRLTGGKEVIRTDEGAFKACDYFWCHLFL